MVIFELSDKSFNAVDELLTADKNRIAIGGWWHVLDEDERIRIHNLNKNKVAVPDPMIIWNEPSRIKQDHKLLTKWLNPIYLKDDAMKKLKAQFLEESHVTMTKFLNEELYYKLLNQLFSVKCGCDDNENKNEIMEIERSNT